MTTSEHPTPAPEVVAATEHLTTEVLASFDAAPERLRALTQGLVQHLHAFVTEHDLTEAEWAYAIGFLTQAGHLRPVHRHPERAADGVFA